MVESMGGPQARVQGRLVAYERRNFSVEINADFRSLVRLLMGLEYLDRHCAIKALAEVMANIVDDLYDVAHATGCDTIHSNYAVFRIIRYYDDSTGRTFDMYYGPWALRDMVERRQFAKKFGLEGVKNLRVTIARFENATDDFGEEFDGYIVMYETDRIIHGVIIVEYDGVVLSTNTCRKFIVHVDEGSSAFAWYLGHVIETLG